ncbi:hypothetical protein CDD81_1543 [Ophiocordyceps australis]|uniref:Uncharacterized protein n=1 Tax=Ophiocordyceps australis TaxID=1399860 RepID=A0A2C5Y115_9HYPO|nr:hypothetical protein CDD81_1543 [Ophiocordyceps australis]
MDSHNIRRPDVKSSRNPSLQQSTAATSTNAATTPLTNPSPPSHCPMQSASSIYSLLHTSGFAEWAARAEAQNQRLGVSSSTPSDCEATPSSTTTSSSSKSPNTNTSAMSSDCFAQQRRSRRDDDLLDSFEDEGGVLSDCNAPDNFIAHYTNYSSMDAELSILKEHLRQRAGY